jgi:hypothetical protein
VAENAQATEVYARLASKELESINCLVLIDLKSDAPRLEGIGT